MFGNLKVGTRLALGFGAITLLLLAISITSVLRLSTLNQASISITEDIYPEVALSGEVVRSALDNGRHLRDMLLATTETEAERAWQDVGATRAHASELLKKLEREMDTDKGGVPDVVERQFGTDRFTASGCPVLSAA